MSPILIRPVQEQLEHDRVIRMLQVKYRRRFNVGLNPGGEQTAPAGDPAAPVFPDLVLSASGRGRRVLGVVEVETSESVNNLEAMAQWVPYSRLQAAFILYVPVVSVDSARRLCGDLGVAVAEIWTYHMLGDELRFIQVYHTPESKPSAKATKPAPAKAGAKPKPKPASKPKSAAGKKTVARAGRAKASSARRPAAKPIRSVTKRSSKKK